MKGQRSVKTMSQQTINDAKTSPDSHSNANVQLRLLAHPDRLTGIASGNLEAPVMVDIDPVDGACNLDCEWCCQASSRASRPMRLMSETTMKRLAPCVSRTSIKANAKPRQFVQPIIRESFEENTVSNQTHVDCRFGA